MNNLANCIQGRRTVTHPALGGPGRQITKMNLYVPDFIIAYNSTGFCDWLSFGVTYSDTPDNSIKEPQKQVYLGIVRLVCRYLNLNSFAIFIL